MKQHYFSRKALGKLLAPLAIAAIPAAIIAAPDTNPDDMYIPRRTIEVFPDTTSGIADANYCNAPGYVNEPTFGLKITIERMSLGYDMNGKPVTVDSVTSLVVRGAKSNWHEYNTEVLFPDTIVLNYDGITHICLAENFDFDYYTPEQSSAQQSFPSTIDENLLKDVYLPATAKSVSWHGQDFVKLRNFHLCSYDVPAMSFSDGAENLINLYVPDEYFRYYTSAVENANYPATVWSEDSAKPVYVNVEIPGTLADQIANVIDNLNDVRWLVVTGTPNEQDLRIIRRLPRLEILDLSQTTGLTTIVGCEGLKYLRKVRLPYGLESIGSGAFENCTALDSINLPSSVKTIYNNAFKGAPIAWANLENVETISGYAFQGCHLRKVNLEHLKNIFEDPFGGNVVFDTLYLPNIEYIGAYAFQNKHIKELKLGDKLTGIREGAFQYNDFKKLIIPETVNSIGWGAFSHNDSLQTITYRSNLSSRWSASSLADNAFAYLPSLREVHVREIFPPQHSGFSYNYYPDGPYSDGARDWSRVTVYVPALALNDYLVSDGWTMFQNIKASSEELTYITIDRPFTLTSDRGIADKANFYFSGMESSLTVRRSVNAPLNMGICQMHGDTTCDYYDVYEKNYYGTTIIPHSVVTAENPEINLSVLGDQWNFISLPFDVNVSEIETGANELWVVRRYDGEARASLSENTWKNMADGDVLKAGQGYILHCAYGGKFTFRPAAGCDQNRMFSHEAVETELASYPSEFAHNASWNLVGNPYPAFLGIQSLEFDGPVTIYAGFTYRAYSPIDDNFALLPYQAFFVQRQDVDGGNAIKFLPEGRFHSRDEAKAYQRPTAATQSVAQQQRALFNITVTGDTGSDRTRVVLNPAAAMAYETNRDASKFMSTETGVPQIFVVNNGVRMAIDERPLANGEAVLGTHFGKAGEYTIALDSRNAEGYTAVLLDTRTGVSTDLTTGAYTFKADAGTDENRFILTFEAQITGIDAVAADSICVKVDGNQLRVSAPEAIAVTVVAVDGRTVAAGHGTDFTATLAQGIYVVKAGETTIKVAVGK